MDIIKATRRDYETCGSRLSTGAAATLPITIIIVITVKRRVQPPATTVLPKVSETVSGNGVS